MVNLSPAESAACRIAGGAAWRFLITSGTFGDLVARVDTVGAETPGSVPSFRISYETPFGAGSVHVAGDAVAYADWEPLRLRRRVILATAICGVLCGGAACADYTARHEWFAKYGSSPAIMTLSALASAVAAVAAAGWLLSKHGRTSRRTWLPTAVTVILAVAALGTARADMPDGGRAAEYLRGGDGSRAQVEAAAALLSDPADRNAREVLDTLRLRAVEAASSSVEVYRLVKEPWFADSARATAVAILENRVSAEVTKASGVDDLDTLRSLRAPASLLPERVQTDIRRATALAGVRRCLASRSFGCLPASTTLALAAEVPEEQLSPLVAEGRSSVKAGYSAAHQRALSARVPSERMARLAEAIAIGKIYSELTQGELSPGLKRLEDLHRTATGDDARQKQAQADKERRARAREAREAAAKAAQLERQERARSRDSASLQCCDGTLSPSCTCAGSRRGCCSHHGGVCGCSQ
jgi:hypothetical protein